ncbi:MAG: hypothetical protein D6731_07895 [Planctomycetota bacterium]|nr:MAG: hypothetical protein D6731_07895 [Planctomycetota bacterium]
MHRRPILFSVCLALFASPMLAASAQAQPTSSGAAPPRRAPAYLLERHLDGSTSRVKTFYDDPGYRPVAFGEYQGLPKQIPSPNSGETWELVRGTLGLSYDGGAKTYVLVVLERVRATLDDGRDFVEVHRQTIFFGAEDWERRGTRLRLREKAPLFSSLGERDTEAVFDERDGTGSLRMRFYHGGRLFHAPYADDRYDFAWRRLASGAGSPSPSPSPGGSGSGGAAGALRGLGTP